jgi:hypothetical protein
MTPTQAITAAEALLLLEGLCDNRVDWLTNWVGRQEVQDGCAGHATKDDGQDGPHAGDDPRDVRLQNYFRYVVATPHDDGRSTR